MRPAGLLGRAALALALAAAGVLGCSAQAAPLPQWVVLLSTDAPLPHLGDRLLVQVSDAEGNAPADWRREIGIDACTTWPVSFGVEAALGGAPRFVHAVLYRSVLVGPDGLPASAALISMAGELPPATGITYVGLDLPMACFGVADTANPAEGVPSRSCDPITGALAPIPALRVLDGAVTLAPSCSWASQPTAGCQSVEPSGDPSELLTPCSWGPAVPVGCPASAVPQGMACIPGGAFLLGSADAPLTALSPLPERLVQLSPFLLDVDEMTVGQVASLVLNKTITEEPIQQDQANGAAAPTDRGACMYLGTMEHDNDALPVNCVSHALARQICAAKGKRLPTEAEWEYAAGNGDLETPYPWGTARGNPCTMALVQRGRTGDEFDDVQSVQDEDSTCRGADGGTWGPTAGGLPPDVTKPTGVQNLAGNVGEWVEDAFAAYDDPCWHPEQQLLVDPVCAVSSPSALISARGASWGDVLAPVLRAELVRRRRHG